MQPATKQYVDATVRVRNRIINGDMFVDQRSAGAQVAAPISSSAYIIDRWKLAVGIAAPSKGTAGQVPVANPALFGGNQYYLAWTTAATGYTPAAGDNGSWLHFIEGWNFNDANWGTANALPVTLEFWAFSSVTGTFAGSVRNGATNRSYIFTFALVASTWTKIRINVPGDTVGAWAVASNASALVVSFNLVNGSNFATAPGVWTAGNFVTAPGAVNIVATANANLYIMGVALMVNPPPNAEPNFKSAPDNLNDCLRYYNKPDMTFLLTGYNTAGQGNFNAWMFPVVMRAVPTVTGTVSGSYNNCSGLAFPSNAASGFRASAITTATGPAVVNFTVTIDADI
jgi:hypothetical protein